MQKEQSNSCEVLENRKLDEVSITPEEYNDILNIQNEILEMLASHGNFTDILARLCQLAESLLPNSVASIMLLNKESGLMSVLSAPTIPQVGHDALKNLQPGPGGGSCGNAVFHNEPQFVQDTFKDSRWTNLRQVAYDFNLCSCWSMPVRDIDKNAIGTFALSSFEHRSPAPFHKKLLETAASIVNIVLKNQESEKRIKLFSTAMQNATEGIIITDKENKITEVNNSFERIYGFKEKEVLGENPRILASKRYTKEFYTGMWKSLEEDNTWSGEIINKRSDGSDITQWLSISALYDEQNHDAHNYLAIFTDLTELKNTQNKIEQMAYRDALTGLCNKVRLEQLISFNTLQTLILLNIDNFSYINMSYGFEIGDKLLKKIAKELKENFTVAHICRIDSDEFALLFNKKIDINKKISNIQNYFYNKKITIENINLNISFSYGASSGRNNLLRNSALALKQAKESGKNSFYIFDQDEDTINHAQREKFIASNNLLHDALSNDNIVPYFQGIRNNKTKKITKFEALARIENSGEIISPFVFLEPAKLSGLLPEITKIMIDKSFKAMSSNSYTFSINITEEDLSKNYLLAYLEEKSLKYKIKSSRVILEILEGISSHGKKNHTKQLMNIKAKGYSIAIDDFGSEYSNFERVLDLEIDFLKIDARYIKDIDTNTKSYEITKAIVFFAKNAGIPCIAEFVHNETVQKVIEKLGIDYSQGYLFWEPTPSI
jgi:PAS domain S-box-containing protein/diguanylate cyclase (GGDEF)-like protein